MEFGYWSRVHCGTMKKLLLAFCLIALGMANAQAAPANDDLETFLSKHNVVSQIQQAGDSMLASASELVGNAMGFLGVRYRYGGTTPETGFDCSGFVRATFEKTLGRILRELVSRTSLILMTYSPSHAQTREEATACGCREHRALIDAIRLRDAREAPRLMLAHLARIESQLEFTPPAAEAPDLARLLGGV